MSNVANTLYVISVANLALAGLVLWRRPSAGINRLFSLVALAVSCWTLTNALFQATDSIQVATIAGNLSYVSALAVSASLFHFSQVFPAHPYNHSHLVHRDERTFVWAAAALLSITPYFGHFVVRSVDLEPNRLIHTNSGLYPLAAFIIITVLGTIASLIKNYRVAQPKQQMQTRYVLTGITVTSIFGLFCNLILPLVGNYSLVWLGPASSVVFVSSTVYAILREHLFDIRIVIKRTLVYSFLLAGIAGVFSLVDYLMTEALKATWLGDNHRLTASIAAAIFTSLISVPAKARLEKLANRLVFGKHHRTPQGHHIH